MGNSTKNISYRYDAVGNRVGMTGPDGGRFTYSYDSLRRMTRVINPQGERTSYSYDDVGRRTLMKLANGTRTSYTYDPANRLTTLGNLKSDGTVISQFDYKYDNVGNRTAVKEHDGSRVTYTYDNLYQLTGEHRTGTTPYRNTYTYDSRGNRTLKNESNVRTTYVYDACNQLRYSEAVGGRTTYTFDNDGNQTKVLEPTGARTTTTWDYENKATVVKLPSGVRNTMSYDTEGMRIKLEDSSGVKKYVWDQQNYLAETDAANDTQVVYTNEPQAYGNLISQRRNNGGVWTPSYYHYEALGSTRQQSNSSQTVTDTYLYDAWGNLITSTGTTVNPFRYVGRLGYYYDPDTTNYYIRARIYRPVIARWLSVDPLGFVDGMNLYKAYMIPDSADPSGRIMATSIQDFGIPEECGQNRGYRLDLQLTNPAPCDGYIVQRVRIDCHIRNCRSAPLFRSQKSYWEAWPVKKGEIWASKFRLPLNGAWFNDTNSFRFINRRIGQQAITFHVRFYCEEANDVPGGIAAVGTGDLENDFLWNPAQVLPEEDEGECSVTPGGLPATSEMPTFWRSGPVEGTLERRAVWKWRCCPCPPKWIYHTLDHTD